LPGHTGPGAEKIPQNKAFCDGAGLALKHAMPAPAFIQTAATAQAMHMAAAAPTGQSDAGGFSLGMAFHDLLDIVNPLQHLPVVGTLYRAVTGDKMGTVEKIAGDALYGGLWGAVGSIADTAFEAVTGKDFGSTVLAFAEDTLGFGHHDAPAQLAANLPAKSATPLQSPLVPQADGADVQAFGNALAEKGVDNEMASRALYAYRRSQGLVPAALN
jgi:hypothetical protein